MKLCKDCVYCNHGEKSTPPPGFPETSPALHWWCLYRGKGTFDVISGNTWYENFGKSCADMRKVGGDCGPDGILFKAEVKP